MKNEESSEKEGRRQIQRKQVERLVNVKAMDNRKKKEEAEKCKRRGNEQNKEKLVESVVNGS